MDDRTDAKDLGDILSDQRRELMAAINLAADLQMAYDLQMQEAVTASLALKPQPSSSSAAAPSTSRNSPPSSTSIDAVLDLAATLKLEDIERFVQERADHERTVLEMMMTKDDLNRRIHDQKFAADLRAVPEDYWAEHGHYYERPHNFKVGSSSSSSNAPAAVAENLRLYCKGLVSEEMVRDMKAVVAGAGYAICDPRDNVMFEARKNLEAVVDGAVLSRAEAELEAVIEGLNKALTLDVKSVTVYCDDYLLYQYITGKWPAKQPKIAVLVNQVKTLRGKFIVCNLSLVPRNDIKFAFQLARDAIESQSQHAQSSSCRNVKENCVICLEDTDVSQMFAVDGCLHRYCFSCMKQHVKVKLLHGMIPRCPHEGCKSDLSVENCAKFLTPKHVETMRQRLKEASIPATEKVYCPYPRCSALMSKRELLEHTKETLRGVELSGVRRCMKCRCLFCINCKVPWHKNTTCTEYKKLNPFPPEEDTKLKFLASRNLWRPCAKCNHMIELSEGCFHMTCRCGYEFCYNCGAEWKEKKATCSCPLWDEGNILYDDDEEEVVQEENDLVSAEDSFFDEEYGGLGEVLEGVQVNDEHDLFAEDGGFGEEYAGDEDLFAEDGGFDEEYAGDEDLFAEDGGFGEEFAEDGGFGEEFAGDEDYGHGEVQEDIQMNNEHDLFAEDGGFVEEYAGIEDYGDCFDDGDCYNDGDCFDNGDCYDDGDCCDYSDYYM